MLKLLHTHIIAFHTWGFDSSFWKGLESLFSPAEGFRFESEERGYFSSVKPKSAIQFEPSLNKVIFAHSFGLHWCEDSILEKADHLVIFNGYLNFHPGQADQFRRSKHSLREMHSQFVKSPESVLNQYYRNAFHPQKNSLKVPDMMNHDLLLADLIRLDNDNQGVQRIFDSKQITIVHGTEDLIVNKQSARSMYHALRFRSRYFEVVKAGHALPVTHSEKCHEMVLPLIT